jgi:hypothetical protein
MNLSHDVGALPAFAALDSYTVLTDRKRGTSIQLDETYFAGQLRALRNFDVGSTADRRIETLEDSRNAYAAIDVEIDSLTERSLREASRRFRHELQAIPEIDYLARSFPGRCFVVPEWLRTGKRLHYGARVYLFGDGDAPDPEDVLSRNIEAILTESFDEFERYQGRLHGYPDCCIDFYQRRSPNAPSPEWRAVEPFADRIRDDALGRGLAASMDSAFSTPLDREEASGFFAREFFPEPGCETAKAIGRAIRGDLKTDLSEDLVRDYFRLNFGIDYLVARAVRAGGDRRPSPGELGREHLLFYLPLREALTTARSG